MDRIIKILDGDKKYASFASRVTKDFNSSETSGIPVAMQAFFAENGEEDIGFCVISISPLKMRQWEKTFKEEGWVKQDFKIDVSSFELMYMYVKLFHRRKGWGSKLFTKVLNYAKRTGIRSIYAFVSDTDKKSLSFYEQSSKASPYESKGVEIIYSLSDEGGVNSSAFLMWKLLQ